MVDIIIISNNAGAEPTSIRERKDSAILNIHVCIKGISRILQNNFLRQQTFRIILEMCAVCHGTQHERAEG